jgi:hypothetical protein
MPTFVEGEGGEPLAPGGLSPPSDTVTPPSSPDTDYSDMSDYGSDSSGGGGGGVTGAGSLSLEVTLLSIDATDKVADEIARRIAPVAEKHSLKGVVIADPASIAMLRVHAALSGELGALETRITGIEAAAAQESSAEGGFVDLAAAAALKLGTKSIAGIASNVGKALKVFAVSSAYSGKKDVVRPSALHAALAKHVSARGLEAQVPRYSVMAGSGSRFIDRLLDVQRRCRSLSDGGTISDDLDSVNMVVSQLTQQLFDGGSGGDTMGGSSGGKLLQQLSEADMIANAIADGFGLMTVELAASGGSYRARKWILNALFGRDGLTYSGGSAVTFFLLAGDRMAALASDTIYFASGHGSFGNRYNRFSPTNIAGFDSN